MMRVFLTGATGFIGSAIVPELLGAGHKVVALVRTDDGERTLTEWGAEPLRGDLDDLDALRRGAQNSDGVIHAGYIHDFANLAKSAATDLRAVELFGEVLAGTGKPLVVTSATACAPMGRLVTEQDAGTTQSPGSHRVATEEATLALAAHGVRAMALRLPPSVHGDGDHGFVPELIRVAQDRGVSAYPGEGLNCWPAVHRLDVVRLYRRILERGTAGSRYHGVADTGVPVRAIAEAIGRGLKLPTASLPTNDPAHFGWIGRFLAIDNPTSSEWTREQLDWHPDRPSLLDDLQHGTYFEQ